MNAAVDVLQSTQQHINRDRLWQSLMDLAQLGATVKGGVCRLALTDLDRQARDLFVQWTEAAGCTVSIDAVGNIFARRPGRNPNLPPVMTGSHIDTQPTGGKFDGCYGVLAGLEVMRTLDDHGVQTDAPLEVAIWTNEEGSRFLPVMMGSGVWAGVYSRDHADARQVAEPDRIEQGAAARAPRARRSPIPNSSPGSSRAMSARRCSPATASTCATPRASRWPTSCAPSAMPAPTRWADARSTPTSRRTSSKAPSWNTKTGSSAW